MVRICVAASGLGHVARGIEAWADDLSQALAGRGEDLLLCKGAGSVRYPYERVVACWKRESLLTRALLRSIPRRIGWRFGWGSGYTIEQNTFARNLIKLLASEQIDILHVQDPLVAKAVQDARRDGRVDTRVILAHGTEESIEFQAEIEYLQHLAPWHLDVARSAGVSRETWTAIPNFIDTDQFFPGRANHVRQELAIPPDGFVILIAAAIKRKHKRIDYLIDEFHKLVSTDSSMPIWFVFAGGWEPDTAELVASAKQRLGHRVRFLIRYPREKMAYLYRAADVFTLGSLKEMMPIALLEATASGLPCVVHQHPVMQWMIGRGGRTIDMREPGNLADSLANLWQDHGRRKLLGDEARHHCLNHFSRETVVEQIVRYYDQVHTHG